MGKLKKAIANLRKIKVQEIVEKNVLKNEDEIVDLNTEGQLSEGQYANEGYLPDYSPTSVEVFGKPAGAIRLFDEGDFYRGFYLRTKEFPFFVDSKDSKTDMLVEKYGEDIFGFTKESKGEIKDIILEGVQSDFKTAIKKSF